MNIIYGIFVSLIGGFLIIGIIDIAGGNLFSSLKSRFNI